MSCPLGGFVIYLKGAKSPLEIGQIEQEKPYIIQLEKTKTKGDC